MCTILKTCLARISNEVSGILQIHDLYCKLNKEGEGQIYATSLVGL